MVRQHVVILGLWAMLGIAGGASATERMVVERNLLIFDLSESSGLPAEDRMILPDDHVRLAELLMENPEIDTIVVSGDGGFSWPAHEMAKKIESFGLHTVARHTCASACTTILLGGAERSMQPGASIGFHRMSNAASDLRATYGRLKDEEGWSDEFAFASHIFERGEIAARDYIAFLLRRGVTPEFALTSLTYSSMDMWYPSEKEMLEAGVLTRRPKSPEEEAAAP
jgi:hypothetical protein